MGATSLTMSLCFMAGVFWERSKNSSIYTCRIRKRKWGKKNLYRTLGEKECYIVREMKLNKSHFIFKPVKAQNINYELKN